ncbi:TPA: transcriptional regulator [Yersinia enterocolitica]|nr:transcriptional regulator [Yersinia enterocolitica]HDL7749213.1 transcriptional regulator [Yersinia enterocolitica]HEN3478646.1 transcriptional regulator [Yersinia enterocolitica]
MNAKTRCKMRRMLRRASERRTTVSETMLEKNITKTLTNCSSRVYKATMDVPFSIIEHASTDNVCLPDVALFHVSDRKNEHLTAR